MEIKKVDGKKKGGVMLYALSTCGWCRKAKALLGELGVEYSYIDVDLLGSEEKELVMVQMERWNPRGSFPTLVINNERCVVGFQEDIIRRELGG